MWQYFLVIIVLTVTTFNQSGLAQPADREKNDDSKRPGLTLDTAQFLADANLTRLEIYQGVSRIDLTYEKAGDQFVATYSLNTKITHADTVVIQGQLVESDTLRALNALKGGQQFVYSLPVHLQPGRYQVITTLLDQNSKQSVSEKRLVEVSAFPADSLAVSEIQLATSIKRAGNASGPFDKNNLTVMPNPAAIFGDGVEKFAMYAELYNLTGASEGSGNYHVDYIIEAEDRDFLQRLPGKPRTKKQESTAIYTSFDISALSSGRYRILVEAFDDDHGTSVIADKKFVVFRKADAEAYWEEQERKIYDAFDDLTLQKYFDQIAYVADEEEKKVFEMLDSAGRRKFLMQFWRDRDPTPGTLENEYKEDYIKRLVKSKIHFGYGDTEGWQTDRGRILLVYGSPDFIDRDPGGSDRYANEIWAYEKLQGRSTIFVFVDLMDNGQYRLIHSDYRNEISNPNWESYLYK